MAVTIFNIAALEGGHNLWGRDQAERTIAAANQFAFDAGHFNQRFDIIHTSRYVD